MIALVFRPSYTQWCVTVNLRPVGCVDSTRLTTEASLLSQPVSVRVTHPVPGPQQTPALLPALMDFACSRFITAHKQRLATPLTAPSTGPGLGCPFCRQWGLKPHVSQEQVGSNPACTSPRSAAPMPRFQGEDPTRKDTEPEGQSVPCAYT